MGERAEVGVLRGVIRERVDRNDKHHITGKPTAVMQALARICVPGGIILDPFAGSATTGVGALLEGRRFLGVELTDDYATIGRERLSAVAASVEVEARRAGQVGLFEGGRGIGKAG
jgi:DNA modification methylase